MPQVSICIPTYNRCEMLDCAISSAVNQTIDDIEIIICDDGSTDETKYLIERYSDRRIKYIRHEQNIGKSNNMLSGLKSATGQFVVKFDDDDRLTPTFVERTSAILESNLSVDFVTTDHWIIDVSNKRDISQTEATSRLWKRKGLKEGPIENLLEVAFVDRSLQIGATLFRRSALVDVGFLRPNMGNCEDFDLFVRLAQAGKMGYYLPERLMEYRVHPGQEGLSRGIAYLSDFLSLMKDYKFETTRLEQVRLFRIKDLSILLGMRLIRSGETEKGREMLWQSRDRMTLKVCAAYALSLLPAGWREPVFQVLNKTSKLIGRREMIKPE